MPVPTLPSLSLPGLESLTAGGSLVPSSSSFAAGSRTNFGRGIQFGGDSALGNTTTWIALAAVVAVGVLVWKKV